ncbi:uncharacterized protein LOC144336968 isoform X2 [Macaca mulatta]
MAKLGSSRGRWQVLGPQGSPLEEGADLGAGVTRRAPTTSRAEALRLGGLGNRWPVVHLTIGQGSACVARPGGGEAGTPSCLQVALVRGSFKRGRCFSLGERRAPRHLRGRGTDGSGSGGARAEVAMAAVAGVRLWTKRRSRCPNLRGPVLLPWGREKPVSYVSTEKVYAGTCTCVSAKGHTCWSSAAAFSRVGAWGLNLWSTLCHLHLVHPRAGPWVPEQTTAR